MLGKGVHESTLQNMWKKATELVKNEGMIVPIPGEKDSIDRMVASRRGQVSHVVRAIKRGIFKCDGQCQMYSTHKLCSHVIAVAEVHGKLEQLYHVHESGKFDPNVSSIVSIGMPSTSGRKPGQNLGQNESDQRSRILKQRLYLIQQV